MKKPSVSNTGDSVQVRAPASQVRAGAADARHLLGHGFGRIFRACKTDPGATRRSEGSKCDWSDMLRQLQGCVPLGPVAWRAWEMPPSQHQGFKSKPLELTHGFAHTRKGYPEQRRTVRSYAKASSGRCPFGSRYIPTKRGSANLRHTHTLHASLLATKPLTQPQTASLGNLKEDEYPELTPKPARSKA